MASWRSARIRRRLAVLVEIARDKIRHREILREQAAIWDSIRPALAAASIDPVSIKILRSVAAAEGELALLGDSPDLRLADAAFVAQDPLLASRDSYAAQVADHVPRFAQRPPPDPGASLFDWYAWSLARRPGTQACTVAMQ